MDDTNLKLPEIAFKKRPRWIPRFSLRTMLIVVFLAGSVTALLRQWAPWQLKHTYCHIPGVDLTQVQLSPDGKLLYSVFYKRTRDQTTDEELYGWDGMVWERDSVVPVLTFHQDPVIPRKQYNALGWPNIEFSPDSRWIWSRSVQHGLFQTILWNVGANRAITSPGIDFSRYSQRAFSPDGKHIVLYGLNQPACVLDLETRISIPLGRILKDFCCKLDNSRICAITEDDEVCEWDFTGTLIRTHTPPMGYFPYIVYAAGSHVVANYTAKANIRDGLVYIYNTGDGRETAHFKGRFVAELSPDQRFIILVDDTKFELLNLDTNTTTSLKIMPMEDCRALIEQESGPTLKWLLTSIAYHFSSGETWFKNGGYVEFSADLRRAATTGHDTSVTLFDTSTSQAVFRFPEHGKWASQARFFPEGDQIATSSEDGFVRLWQQGRPEAWWGVIWLSGFWLTLIFVAATVWTVRKDFHFARTVTLSTPVPSSDPRFLR